MSDQIPIKFRLNGKQVASFVEPRKTLADFLRDDLGFTATRLGCEMGTCGACLVMMNNAPAHACLVLTVQAEGEEITTLEGMNEIDAFNELKAAFVDRNAAQCGYCTTGMLVSAVSYVNGGGDADRENIREALSGNYCRCTGYEAVVDAIANVVKARAAK